MRMNEVMAAKADMNYYGLLKLSILEAGPEQMPGIPIIAVHIFKLS